MKTTRFASPESLPIHHRYIGTFPCISAIVTERDKFVTVVQVSKQEVTKFVSLL